MCVKAKRDKAEGTKSYSVYEQMRTWLASRYFREQD